MDGILSLIEGEDSSKPAALVHIVQAWLTPVRPAFSFIGRYVPEQEFQAAELDDKLSIAGKRDFEDWLRESTTLVVNTEINVQLGEFTIKKNAVQPLAKYMMKNADFVSVFHKVTTDDVIQCADVKNTTNRKWVRLVGLGYDLQLWAPDTRRPSIPLKNAYEACTANWVKDIFDPWRNMVLPNVELYVLSEAVVGQSVLNDSEIITLCGFSENPYQGEGSEKTRRESRGDVMHAVTIKEVVVYRYPRVFHIYNVVEYGRRWYRQLVFSSEPNLSLHEMKMSRQELNSTILECSGDSSVNVDAAVSLVISKDALQEGSGKLMYLPSRLLCGLMPSSLLNQYNFWQKEDDSLVGYMPVLETNKSVSRSILHVQLNKGDKGDPTGFCNSLADALISRVFIADSAPSQTDSEKEFDSRRESSKPTEYLVNLMAIMSQYVKKFNNSGAPEGPVSKIKELVDFEGETATLHALVRLLLRLDCLANVLAWSKSDPHSTADALISIDTIELPRLRLTFEKKVSSITGHVQYMCVEQTGMYLTGYDDSLRFANLLEGLPRAVLLTNADNEYFVLLPAIAKPVLTKSLGSGPATYNMVMSMTNKQWLANTGEAAYFTYPIHYSGCFMSSRSIASSLYLLVLRLMSRNYRDAFRLIESCVCDNVLTPQEKQIYDVIGTIKDDFHPDVHACRLKLYFVTYGCSDVMPYQFNVETELVGYVSKIRLVSSYCKLSPDEEIFVINSIPADQRTPHVVNRERIIRASFNLSFESTTVKLVNRKFAPVYPKLATPVVTAQLPVDLDSLDTSKPTFKGILSKLTIVRYSRPESLTGPSAITYITAVLDEEKNVGFFFLYELMTEALVLRILPDDPSHNIGSVFLRLLPESYINGVQGAILRVVETHPELISKLPVFEDKRKLKLPSLAGLDVFQTHIKAAATAVNAQIGSITVSRMTITTPAPYRPPATLEAAPTLQDDTTHTEGRSWLNPRITDFKRPSRTVSSRSIPSSLFKVASHYTIDEISHLATAPLGAINLDHYIELRSLANRGEAPVSSESPLRVMLHPSSNSHIARSAVKRLEQDVVDFSADENKGVLPVLKAINSTGGALVGAGIDRALASLTGMIDSLAKLRERDAAIVKSGVKELLDFCNSTAVHKSSNNVHTLAHSLQLKAGTEVSMVRLAIMLF